MCCIALPFAGGKMALREPGAVGTRREVSLLFLGVQF